MNPIVDAITGILSPVATFFTRKAELSAQSHQLQLQINDAQAKRQIDLISQGRADDASWELESIKMGQNYRGFELYILTIPMVLCFTPWVGIVSKGFAALETTPKWYQIILASVYLANYGYRLWRRNQTDT